VLLIYKLAFLLQEYNFKEVSDREFLLSLHRNAAKHRLNIQAYNRICNDIARIEDNLSRLRDPIQLALPPAPRKQVQSTD